MAYGGSSQVRSGLEPLLPRLWRYALVLTRDRGLAEDLVQSTCVRALEKARGFRPDTHLDRWVFRIMANHWKNLLRANARRPRASADAVDQLPARGIEASELAVYTRQVLERVTALPEAQRTVVVLVCFEQFTYRQTAEILDVPPGTVMSRLHHARKALGDLKSIRDAEEAQR